MSYISHSEPEQDHKYADLCLLRRPDALTSSLRDLLFKFKRLSLEELGMIGRDVRTSSRGELMALENVSQALDRAEAQAVSYRSALTRRYEKALKLRTFAVVALGFERIVARTVE